MFVFVAFEKGGEGCSFSDHLRQARGTEVYLNLTLGSVAHSGVWGKGQKTGIELVSKTFILVFSKITNLLPSTFILL
jgi:hypothetical protein